MYQPSPSTESQRLGLCLERRDCSGITLPEPLLVSHSIPAESMSSMGPEGGARGTTQVASNGHAELYIPLVRWSEDGCAAVGWYDEHIREGKPVRNPGEGVAHPKRWHTASKATIHPRLLRRGRAAMCLGRRTRTLLGNQHVPMSGAGLPAAACLMATTGVLISHNRTIAAKDAVEKAWHQSRHRRLSREGRISVGIPQRAHTDTSRGIESHTPRSVQDCRFAAQLT